MDATVSTALVAGISAIAGGVISAIVAPYIKHRIDDSVAEKGRRREQIAKWRQMIMEVNQAAEGNISPSEFLQLHADYITLEPYLTPAARRVAHAENRTWVVGQALSLPLETLKNEIARIESEWGLSVAPKPRS